MGWRFAPRAARWALLGAWLLACTESPSTSGPAPVASDGKPRPVPTVPQPSSAPIEAVLGDVTLTSGLPGDGPLTRGELEPFLADPRNHATLRVRLPLGLDLGAAAMTGLGENPLTRAKIELGRQLFFEARLSADGRISCASCHDPRRGFAGDTPVSAGVGGQQGKRNAPAVYNRLLGVSHFWDGRASSLEQQALGPLMNPLEMASSAEHVLEILRNSPIYAREFEVVFPARGLSLESVTRALAAFERALVTGPSPYDYHERLRPFLALSQAELEALRRDDAAAYAEYERLSASAKQAPMGAAAERGMELFFSDRVNCKACHTGPNLSDESFHNLGVGMDAKVPDLGRFGVTGKAEDRGAFRTPTLRNVASTAPYMHDGSLGTLDDVVAFYERGGINNPALDADIRPIELSPQERTDLVEFMKACSGALPHVATGRLPE